ncbi:MAG: hypothetical protein IJ244_08710 [Bacteroidaceae bacterium]|nr:hypothetical protein [Bacteroidaceae bacterium]
MKLRQPLFSLLRLSVVLALLLGSLSQRAQAQNEVQARRVFERTLALVENKGGARMDYELKVTRLFTQTGKATIKNGKSLTETKNGKVWFNGKTGWWMDLKKGTVTLFSPNYKRHISMTKQLETARNGSSYTLTEQEDGYLVKIKTARHSADIRECVALIDKKTFAPKQLKFKWKIFWFTIDIWNFHTGDYPDTLFSFPEKDYPNLKIIDKRKE